LCAIHRAHEHQCAASAPTGGSLMLVTFLFFVIVGSTCLLVDFLGDFI
jgi:hypothetical protein